MEIPGLTASFPGQRHGKGVMIYRDQSRYRGEWRRDLQHGSGTMTYSDRSVYEGEWKRGLRHGWGEYKDLTKSISYSGQWEYNLPHGEGELRIKNKNENYYYKGEPLVGIFVISY